MKTKKLTAKLIGKTITVLKVRDERGNAIEGGEMITGVYEGRDYSCRPSWVRINGLHISSRNWEVVA
jgi:hypothetical protein